MSNAAQIQAEILEALSDHRPRKRAELMELCPTADKDTMIAIELNTLQKQGKLLRSGNGYWHLPKVVDAPEPSKADAKGGDLPEDLDPEDLDEALRVEQQHLAEGEEREAQALASAKESPPPAECDEAGRLLREQDAEFRKQLDKLLHDARLELSALRDERMALIRETSGPDLASIEILNAEDITAPCPVMLALMKIDAGRDEFAALYPYRTRTHMQTRAHNLLQELDELRALHASLNANAD